MKKLMIFLFCMVSIGLCAQSSFGALPSTLNPKKICGTYQNGRSTIKIKRNVKFKSTIPAPRSFVTMGVWEIHNDTLVCYATRKNTSHNNEGKKIKGKPVMFNLIMVGEQTFICAGSERYQIKKIK